MPRMPIKKLEKELQEMVDESFISLFPIRVFQEYQMDVGNAIYFPKQRGEVAFTIDMQNEDSDEPMSNWTERHYVPVIPRKVAFGKKIDGFIPEKFREELPKLCEKMKKQIQMECLSIIDKLSVPFPATLEPLDVGNYWAGISSDYKFSRDYLTEMIECKVCPPDTFYIFKKYILLDEVGSPYYSPLGFFVIKQSPRVCIQNLTYSNNPDPDSITIRQGKSDIYGLFLRMRYGVYGSGRVPIYKSVDAAENPKYP